MRHEAQSSVRHETQTAPLSPPDPGAWVDRHGDALFRYALFRLRDAALAEDIVQETLLAALQSHHTFAGRGSERTWLVGILKHKIIDHFRRACRERAQDQFDEAALEHEELFQQSGEWIDHWDFARGPIEWHATPAALLEQNEFWGVFQNCLAGLPERIAATFTLREIDGLSSEEICEALNIKANNLWVMLHRARMHLRQCIEAKWFRANATQNSSGGGIKHGF
ncbi:MAG: sigma-70 family RNA polymerase sigma factor [Pyrinomonadaceae bacterium]|nr:sigma-70 family RNA polymerase sigma factor [Pyrinomonadaceae bacterium]